MNASVLRVAALLLAAASAIVCAPPTAGEGSPQLQLMMSGAFLPNTRQIQVAVLRPAASLVNQADLDKRCIKDVASEVGAQHVLLQIDEQNKPRARAVAFDAADNEVHLTGIEPGSDYLFVAEAISNSSTLLASGRSRVDKFDAKENPAINLALTGMADGGTLAPCDPTISTSP